MKKAITISAILIFLIILVLTFPIYRFLNVMDIQYYYDKSELQMIAFAGTPWDRSEAKEVMDLAHEAFKDCKHTREENSEKYGKLSRYVHSIESYPDVEYVKYSLELWSAHFGKNEGYLWVYYTHDGYNGKNEHVCGSSKVPSLWKAEKNENGKWAVTDIKEHP